MNFKKGYSLNLVSLAVLIFVSACSSKKQVDLLIYNAHIYTVDSAFGNAESFAIKDGKFVAVGTNEEIRNNYEANKEQVIDMEGKAIYPGFIDSHCHFYGYGAGLQEVDLVGTKSFDEVIQRIVDFSKINKQGWVIGRGWDQNDWEIKEFPDKTKLDEIFKDTPVLIYRIDGHAAIANNAALKLASISAATKISGGAIEIKNKELTGLLVDNAVDLVQQVIPLPSKKQVEKALLDAQENCFAVGLTTVDDAGLTKNVIEIIDELQKSGELKMRIYAMLTDNKENMDYYLEHGKYKTDRLNVCSFKFYADGALGSRGACLLKPYADKKEQGFLLNDPQHYNSAAAKIYEKGFQMNTHCIGDSAVRFIQNIYFSLLSKNKEMPRRWRIEHLQVTTPEDMKKISRLSKGSIIPSVQPTHATSDMYWAKDRLGEERIHYAYAYKELLKASGIVALGTDFPVERINPLYSFYAAVARKDLKGFPEKGFAMENALSKEDALRGMTIWGAYANFEEKEKGSIEVGKFADFVVLDNDILKMDINKVPDVKVVETFINGERVYQ